MSRSLRLGSFVLVAVLCTTAAVAAPTASDKAAAQTLFDDALKLLAKKQFAEACKKLVESQRLDPAMGTQFRLAECWEQVGKTASAWALFREVADQAKATGQAKRELVARERARRLEGKLARLTIETSEPTKGLEVLRDDTPMGDGQLGTALPIDPGTHRVGASAAGKKPWTTEIEVAPEGSVTVTIPKLVDVPRPPPPRPPEGTWLGPTALVAGGVGVVSLGVSAALVLSARSLVDDSGAHCQGNACDPDGLALRDRAVARGNRATLAFAIGVVGVVSGATLWLLAPSGKAPAVGLGPGTLHLEGRF